MTTVQDLQRPIDLAIVEVLTSMLPPSASYVELILDRAGPALGAFAHTFRCDLGSVPSLPEESLFEHTYELDALVREHQRVVVRARYYVRRVEGASQFQWESSFEYAT